MEEAELIHHLFRRQWPELSGTTLHADLGGGSTELSLEQDAQLLWQDSLPLGVLRQKLDLSSLEALTEAFAKVSLNHRQLVVSGGSAREWGEQLVSEGILGSHEQGRSIFEYQFLPLRKAKTRSATIFSRLIEMWKPEQVVIPRIGLKEGLLLNLAEELRNEECVGLGKKSLCFKSICPKWRYIVEITVAQQLDSIQHLIIVKSKHHSDCLNHERHS